MYEPNYRVCYPIDKMNVLGEEIYEVHKYCKCPDCSIRQPRKVTDPVKEPRSICITTRDIKKIYEIADFIKGWTCEDNEEYLPRVYINWDANTISKGGNSPKNTWR